MRDPFRLLAQRIGALRPPHAPALSEGKAAVGRYGEDCAARELIRRGDLSLGRNAHVGGHEVDIIAEDRECIVFCEVKTRTLTEEELRRFGRPAEAVRPEQIRHLRTAAGAYYAARSPKKPLRFDIVEIYLSPDTEKATLDRCEILTDAFR